MAYAVKRVEEAEDYPYHGNYGTSSATYNRALDVTSLTPHRLTQLLLEGAVTSTVQAIAAIEMEDDAGKMASIERSILIVNSLRESLNMEKGGAIAENLEVVYLYARQEMLRAVEENCAETLKVVVDYLAGISDSWRAIAR